MSSGEDGLLERLLEETRCDSGAGESAEAYERRGMSVYTHKFTKGYPTNVEMIVSEEGYGANAYIATTKPIVVITGPGPGSGKLATALSQLYHERQRGIGAGYAKFETFPIWNLPLKHPVNVAYESATADRGRPACRARDDRRGKIPRIRGTLLRLRPA